MNKKQHKLMREIWGQLEKDPNFDKLAYTVTPTEGWCLQYLSRYSYVLFDFNQKMIIMAGESVDIVNNDIFTALLELVLKNMVGDLK